MRSLKIFLFTLLISNVFAAEQILAARVGLGYNNFLGKDLNAGATGGFSWSVGAFGGQPISDGKNYWGVTTNFSQRFSGGDTTAWNNSSGMYDKAAKYSQHGEYMDLSFVWGRKFFNDFFLFAGPQVSYLVSCSKTINNDSRACDSEFSPFQAEAQAKFMYFLHDSFTLDVKYVQSFLPADSFTQLHIYTYIINAGFSLVF